jgi:hypothetical protein
MTTKKDPRADFNGRSDDDLRRELAELAGRKESLARALQGARPLREEVLENIAEVQAIATKRVQNLAKDGLWRPRTSPSRS